MDSRLAVSHFKTQAASPYAIILLTLINILAFIWTLPEYKTLLE